MKKQRVASKLLLNKAIISKLEELQVQGGRTNVSICVECPIGPTDDTLDTVPKTKNPGCSLGFGCI